MILLLLIPLAVATVILLCALALVGWIASGESDVNGDPERDAGMTPDELDLRWRAWDHGSRRTEARPNLDYARRLNRNAMRSHLNA